MPIIYPLLRLAVLLLLALSIAPAEAAKVNKWVDQQGRVHYGATAPQGVQSQSMGDATSSASQPVAAAPEVVLYSTSWCNYCRRARTFMRNNGIQFTDRDIEKDSAARAEHQRLGGVGVPFLVRDGEILKGYRKATYERFFAQ